MSIILRYLTRQVLISMLAVSGILLLVFMSGRFIKYLAQAASGQLSGDVLFLIMAYRFPGFLELILPLGLFIGILLAYGRMYLDSEMSVLYACGVSERRIVMHTMVSASVVMLLVGAMSLHFSPWGMQQVQRIFTEQARMTEFEMLTPGRFQSLRSGERVTYTEALSEDRRVLSNVFIAEPGREGRPPVLIRARSGSQFVDEQTGARFLVLRDGARYEGVPGQRDYQVVSFDVYGLKLDEPTGGYVKEYKEAIPTMDLWASDDPRDRALLHWRLALPLTVPVVALLAVRLSRVNPRQGRFFQLLPAMLIYVVYLGALIGARDAIAKGRLPEWAGLWWVHALFLAIVLAMYLVPMWRRRVRHAHA